MGTGGGQHPCVASAAGRGDGARVVPAPVRDHLGQELRALYASAAAAELPVGLFDLVARLDAALSGHGTSARAAFREDLLTVLPGLRAFALSLAVNPTQADDLVQETLVKAWANQHRFEPGSNLKGWLCTIMRNQFYTECRKRKREVEDADGALAARMTAAAAQEHGSDLRTVWDHLGKLPPLQREALMLVGAQGMTYKDAAIAMGCQVGTAKSRVSRARTFLAASLGMREEPVPA